MNDLQPEIKSFISYSHSKPYKLTYYDWGDKSNNNILICVHGLTRNGRDFDYIARKLTNNYRIIALDVVGRGLSDRVDISLYNYDTYIKDIQQLYSELNIKTADFLGTSMGGIIAMTLSCIDKNAINKMILNDIGSFIPKSALAKIAKYVSLENEFDSLLEAKQQLKINMTHFGIKKEQDWDYITKYSVYKTKDNKYKLSYDPNISTMLKDDKGNDIGDVDLSHLWLNSNFDKCLIIRGKTSNILLSSTLNEMLNQRPNVHSILFDEVGHAPALMEEDQIAPVCNWLLK